jgi:hypothetical protein
MRTPLVVALLTTAAVAGTARADEAARVTARSIAEHGDAQFYAGRCDKAIALWRKADAVFHAPTIVLRIARCQALLGQVVAAAATLESLTREPKAPDEPPVFAAAREASERELPRLRARIASISVDVRANGGSVPYAVDIDGARIVSPWLPTLVDPGSHRVRVTAGEATWTREVALDDGEVTTIDVPIRVEALPLVSTRQRNVGLAAFGVGVAGLATGVGFSVAALSIGHSLDAICGPARTHCPASAQGSIDRARAYSLAADGTLVAGGISLAAGVVLVTVDLRLGHPERVHIAASPAGATLAGEL